MNKMNETRSLRRGILSIDADDQSRPSQSQHEKDAEAGLRVPLRIRTVDVSLSAYTVTLRAKPGLVGWAWGLPPSKPGPRPYQANDSGSGGSGLNRAGTQA